METAVPDAREVGAAPAVEEPGRVPTPAETATDLDRAAAALAEIEQRRQLDQRRAEEEQRSRQLAEWAADDRDQQAATDQAAQRAAE